MDKQKHLAKFLFLWICLLLTGCEFENPLAVPTVTPVPATPTAAPTATLPPAPDSVAGFRSFLANAQGSDAGQRQSMVNRFMAQLSSGPIIDEYEVVFVLRSEGQSAKLIGDMNNWRFEDAPELNQLEGTDLWYLEASFENAARLDYRFVINDSQWIIDPINSRTMASEFGPNSEVLMPAYEIPQELLPSQETIESGTITSYTINSTFLNQTRTFVVYSPNEQLIGERLPTIIFNDGGDYLSFIGAAELLDRLIAQRLIPPLVAVFIPPINRDEEYTLNDAYVSFMADELVPFVRTTYGTDPDPARTGLIGVSVGGLAAVYSSLSRPDVFGLAAGQSGTYTAENDALLRWIGTQQLEDPEAGASLIPTRIYLVVGTYETAVAVDGGSGDLLGANRNLSEVFSELGLTHQLEERPEGHSWGLWRGTLGGALNYLLSP